VVFTINGQLLEFYQRDLKLVEFDFFVDSDQRI
jgi:hypothetical protein